MQLQVQDITKKIQNLNAEELRSITVLTNCNNCLNYNPFVKMTLLSCLNMRIEGGIHKSVN